MSGVIVVGVDRSEGASKALAWALQESAARGARLVVVTSVPVAAEPGMWTYAPVDVTAAEEMRQGAEDGVRAMVEEVRQGGDITAPVDVQVRAEFGVAADALLRVCAEEHADQLIVGSRGAGGMSRLLLGSVSSSVVHHASCPVTVVPLPHERSRRHQEHREPAHI